MEKNNNYKNKLTALLEAISEMTDQDLEAARAVISAIGKDPDAIIEKSLKRLDLIRKYHGSRPEGAATIYVLALEGNTIIITSTLTRNGILNIDEVYALESGSYTWNTGSLQIRERMIPLTFSFHLGPGNATAIPYVTIRGKKHLIDIRQLPVLKSIGYFIIDNILYPLDTDTIAYASEILELLSDQHTLSLKDTLHFFAERADTPWAEFVPEEFNISQIANNELYSGQTGLFVGNLYPYQQQGLQWLKYCCINKIGGILGDDMGLGKTAQTIALIAWLIETELLENVLIVVPSTLIENWRREMAFFTPSIIPYIHHGNDRTGSPKRLRQEKVIITSYSLMVNDQFVFDKITWGLILMDEASLIKNPDSERRKAIAAIAADVKIVMSGTPVENSLIDLWSLADVVNPGYLGTRGDFSSRYMRKDLSNLQDLRNTVSRIMLRRKKEDVLENLPERIDIHQVLVQNDREILIYEEERLNLVARTSLPDLRIEKNILQQIQEMRQYTTHPYLPDRKQLATASIEELKQQSVKFARTMELLTEIRDREEKVLIFTEYLDMIDAFARTLPEHFRCKVFTIDGRVDTPLRQPNIDLFGAEEGFSIMVLNPKTAGMGLNITPANHVIHYTRQWNPALEEQASARAYRNGQTKAVNIYYLYYAGTIEEVIDNRLKEKKQLSGEVISETDTGTDMAFYLNALAKSPIIK